MSLFGEDIKVAENEVCEFYTNSCTEGAEQWAKTWGIDDIKCLIAVQKINPADRAYVLIRHNDFIYESQKYESVAVHIDVIAISEGKVRS